MVSRSLTEVFILMRNNSIQSRQLYSEQFEGDVLSDRVALIKRNLVVEEDIESGGGGQFNSGVPPVWIDDLEDIRYNSTLIQQKMKELDMLQTNHVQRPKFDDDSTTEIQIEELTHDITQRFANCHHLVLRMQSKGMRSSASEKRLKENVIRSVVNSLQELSVNFRSSQGQYLKKITEREEMSNRYFEVPDLLDSSPYSYDKDFLAQESGPLQDKVWTQQQLLALEDDNIIFQEREREVQQILKSIVDLNTIFRDIGLMVQEQSGIVDRIDYNVENTHVKIEEGVKHLQKASRYQNRNRKCIFLVSTVVLTVLLIILLIAFASD